MSSDEPNITPPSPTDDTVDELPDGSEPSGGKRKTCCNCGKDLTGHRRFKDSVGYWCKDCHRTDKARHKANETKCADCGRLTPIPALQNYSGRRICFNCYKDALQRDKREHAKRVSQAEHSKHEKSHLIILCAIAALLIAIILYSKLRGPDAPAQRPTPTSHHS